MTHPLLARFSGEPALYAPELRGRVEAYLNVLASDPNVHDTMRQGAAQGDGFWPAPNSALSSFRPYLVADGVLQIPVKGILLHDFSLAYGSSATGYVYFRRALERGLADQNVKGIAFVCNSPGGEVAGNFDLADAIYSARGRKPMQAFASESAYSAAYSIASAADGITVARTGGVGSIGVVTSHVDQSKALNAGGLKVTLIYAGEHKVDGNPYHALSAGARDRLQAHVDGLYRTFTSTVARNRGLSDAAVRATQALSYDASTALSLGLADRVGWLGEALAAFAAEVGSTRRHA